MWKLMPPTWSLPLFHSAHSSHLALSVFIGRVSEMSQRANCASRQNLLHFILCNKHVEVNATAAIAQIQLSILYSYAKLMPTIRISPTTAVGDCTSTGNQTRTRTCIARIKVAVKSRRGSWAARKSKNECKTKLSTANSRRLITLQKLWNRNSVKISWYRVLLILTGSGFYFIHHFW